MITTALFRRAVAAVVLGMGAMAWGDSVTVNRLEYKDVVVQRIQGDVIVYTTASGNEVNKRLSEVQKITLTGENAFNAAETAFASEDWAKATTEYARAARTTQKAWLKEFISVRLLESAIKADRFDEAIKGYIDLADKNPAAAAGMTLNMPASNSSYLPEAIRNVDGAIGRTKSDETREVLLNLLIKLHTAKGDTKGAQEATGKLVELRAKRDPNSPEVRQAMMLMKIQSMQVALAAKEWDKVINLVETETPNIIEPSQQAEALYAYAEAKAGKAAGGSGDWKDVAVAYIRVVANAPKGSSQIPEALMKAAEIHLKHLNEPQTAKKIYQQVEAENKGKEVANRAKAALAAIK